MRSVDEVLGSMSLEEKVAQLSCGGRCYELEPLSGPEPDVHALLDRFPFGVGQLGRPSVRRTREEALRLTDRVQVAVRSRTRAGVGVLFNEEGVHGLMGGDATVFPAALAMGATWDAGLVEAVYTVVAREARAGGSNYVYAPVLDLARDPRWGRMEETFGEDPHLVASLGVAAVRGLQGVSRRIAPDRVLACAKHFVGHGVPQAGSNGGPVGVGERELRRDHLVPFAAVISQADVGAIMVAYHDLDGIPMHIHSRWLGDVLRSELGFSGLVTSDGFGVSQLASVHRVASDPADAARLAFGAGIDCEVPEAVGASTLVESVESGQIDSEVIDRACRQVLVAKERLGLLDRPSDAEVPQEVTDVDPVAGRDLARRAAERAVVLLTNDRSLLPLDADSLGTLLVCGPNAEHAHLGGYTDPDAVGVSVLDGIRDRLGASMVRFEEGCRITDEPAGAQTWWHDEVHLADPTADDERLAAAVAAAVEAEVAIVVIGGNEATHREGWWFDHLGDRSDLTMVGRQDELVERIAATGTPTVALVISAGPVDLRRVVDAADAVIWTCYPGVMGGEALARVLFGDAEPGGRLPITFPRSIGQIPIYSGRQPSAGRGYLHGEVDPLFEVGHGLSYANFDVGDLRTQCTTLTLDELAGGDVVHIALDIANVGNRAGSELIRVYVDDCVASVAQPRRLAAFQRIELDPGARTTVYFGVGSSAFTLIDTGMQERVEPGDFEITVIAGGRSPTFLAHVVERSDLRPD